MQKDTHEPAYKWDGKRKTHPLRLVREALGWDKAMPLADAAGLDRLDINALEKGKNKGGAARVVNRLSRVLFLTPWEVEDLLTFRMTPDDAIAKANERMLEGSEKWVQLTGTLPVLAEPRSSSTPKSRKAARDHAATKHKQALIADGKAIRTAEKQAEHRRLHSSEPRKQKAGAA